MSFDPVGLKPIHFSRLNIIKNLIDDFDGTIPLHQYLQKRFSQHKEFGSGDRKLYRSWCYAWYRLGKALPESDFHNRLFAAYYLVNGSENDLFIQLAHSLALSDFLDSGFTTFDSRLNFLQLRIPGFNLSHIFSFNNELSNGLNHSEYARSMLRQPMVYIRALEGKEKLIEKECNDKKLSFGKPAGFPGIYSFQQGVDLIKLDSFEKGLFEIQDFSSQLSGMAIPALPGEHWWDCCCGAGGKSLQLMNRVSGLSITASDNRSSILKNFSIRLKRYRNNTVTLQELDLEKNQPDLWPDHFFDGIIADVPCTGSGTWSRTPEWLTFFDASDIQQYVSRQKSILTKLSSKLKKGGTLVYITCSVFRDENEENVTWLLANSDLTCEKQELINGIENLSDSMFYAVLKKNT